MNQTILNRSRLDKFTLVLDLPIAMRKKTDNLLQSPYKPDKIQFTVFGSPVPKVEVKSIDLAYSGQHMNITSGTRSDYGPLSLKFLVDNGYQNYWILWNWLNLFNNNEFSNSEINQPLDPPWDRFYLTQNPFSEYVTDFVLYSMDEYNNKLVEFKYSNSFITSLGEINFSHQDEGIITCSANFAYNQLQVNLLNNTDTVY
jgi:hypothetical protein